MVQEEHIVKLSKNKIITLILCLVLFILALLYCKSQQIFTVKKIMVQGQFELSEKEIIQISGIKRGENMFDLNLVEGIKNLVNEPYIYNVYIFRQFPDRINIHVIERNPIALIKLSEDYAIDAFGIILPTPKNYPLESIPIITGLDPELPLEMGKLTFHPEIRKVLNLIVYVQEFDQKLISYCSQIKWSEDKGWSIRKEKNYPEVYLGKTDLNAHFDLLEAFIAKIEKDGGDVKDFKYINLRFENQIIVSE